MTARTLTLRRQHLLTLLAPCVCPDLSIATMQVGKPAEEDLKNWGHHTSVDSVPDPVMQAVGQQHVTFIFSCQVGSSTPFNCSSAQHCKSLHS